MTCKDVFDGMADKFQELRLKDVHGVFQFNIAGRDGGQWNAVCRGDHCLVGSGIHPRPDVTIAADSKAVVRLAQGRMHPAVALLTRKVKVKGNPRLIAKMKTMLSAALL